MATETYYSHCAKLIFLLALYFVPFSSYAANRKLTAMPRAVGRTTKNMVTFRSPWIAAAQWGSLGAAVADGIVSAHVLATLPSSYEANPLFGKHPSIGKYLAITIPAGMFSATVTQYGHETNEGWRSGLPFLITGTVHGAAIAWNEHLLRQCEQIGITCR